MSALGLSGLYLERLLRSLPTPLHNFRGVFSIDAIPRLTSESSIIFNLSRVAEKGSHFVAIYLSRERLYFFDSLGIISYLCHPTLQTELLRLTQYYDVPLEIVIREPIQPMQSLFCGFYCIYFILLYDSAKPPQFRPDSFYMLQSPTNDDIVVNNIIMWINVSRHLLNYVHHNI